MLTRTMIYSNFWDSWYNTPAQLVFARVICHKAHPAKEQFTSWTTTFHLGELGCVDDNHMSKPVFSIGNKVYFIQILQTK